MLILTRILRVDGVKHIGAALNSIYGDRMISFCVDFKMAQCVGMICLVRVEIYMSHLLSIVNINGQEYV